MKNLFVLISTVSVFFLTGCHKYVDPDILFYQEGYEITSNNISVDLDSSIEMQIECMAPTVLGHVDYKLFLPNNDNYIDLNQRPDILHVYYQNQSESLQGNRIGEVQRAVFKMDFSEPTFHIGDTCVLNVSIPELEKSLRFIVKSL